jgi:RiboL-PSP-HEPN
MGSMSDFEVFSTVLQETIEERVSILFEIERAIFTKRYSLSSRHREIFSTQSVSMLYSVWEGFVQTSFNLYIDEINRLNLKVFDLCDPVVIHHMENSFKQFKAYPENPGKKAKFFRSLQEFHVYESENCSLPRIINTESNVGFSVLNRLLETFSLEKFTEYWKEYKHPQPNLKDSMDLLLKLRNSVAHGGDLAPEHKVDQVLYGRFKNLVIDLMYEIREKMLDGIRRKTFILSEISA